MKIMFLIFALLLASLAHALDYEFLAGSADKFILVSMYDASDGSALTGLLYSDMTITYTRNNGSADVDIAEATMTMGTHADGGFIEVDATNSPGLYQFGIPDAAIASGAEGVIFSFEATGAVPRFVFASIINVDLRGSSYVPANAVQVEGSDATDQINAAADTALTDYDAPTNAELNARTLVAANYFDFTTDTVTTDSASRTASQADVSSLATSAALATAQADLDILTGADGATLATSQPNYAPATAASLSTAQGDITAILADTAAVDTTTEMRTFLTGADTPVAKDSSVTGLNDPTAAAIADSVWEELIADHSGTSGSTAEALNAAGDPWTTALPGAYGAGTAGNIVGNLNDLSAAEVNAEVDTALADYDGPTNAEMVARTLLAASYATAAAQSTAQTDLDTLTGTDGVTLAASQPNYAPATASALATHDGKLDTVDANVDTLITNVPDIISLAAINAQVDTALSDIYIDRLFATDYDPASKPGTATALLNELIGNDGGVSQFTANALELAPGGGSGGDATAANQDVIKDWLQGIMSKDHTLSTSVGTFDPSTDSLEAVSTAVAGITGTAGDTEVTSDTGGSGALAYKTSLGAGIGGATVTVYPTSEYNAGTYSAVTSTTTRDDGSWGPIYLNNGVQYTLVFRKTGPNPYGPNITTVTP